MDNQYIQQTKEQLMKKYVDFIEEKSDEYKQNLKSPDVKEKYQIEKHQIEKQIIKTHDEIKNNQLLQLDNLFNNLLTNSNQFSNLYNNINGISSKLFLIKQINREHNIKEQYELKLNLLNKQLDSLQEMKNLLIEQESNLDKEKIKYDLNENNNKLLQTEIF